MKQIHQVGLIDGIKNVHWHNPPIALNFDLVVVAKCSFRLSKYTTKSNNIQSNHTFKIFQIFDVAYNFTRHNYINFLEYFATQTTFYQTLNLHKDIDT
jgi:hypothetical protein